MKFVSKYISLILLLLCTTVAEAQVATNSALRTSSSAMVATPTVQDPAFTNSNSLLDRNITVRPMQQTKKENNGSYTAAPIYTGRHSSVQPVGASKAGAVSRTDGKNIFNTGITTAQKNGTGSLGLFTESELDKDGLDSGFGDYRPGEITPLGEAFVPLVLLLLCYCLFLIVRGDARKDQEEAA